MKRYVADKDGHWVELDSTPTARVHVQDDLKEFALPGGKQTISGKRQWREHLKRTGTVEMSHGDLAASKTQWEKRKAAFAADLAKAPKDTRPADVNVLEARDYERTRLNNEVKNKLHNRPTPDRITLINLAFETARELAKRR